MASLPMWTIYRDGEGVVARQVEATAEGVTQTGYTVSGSLRIVRAFMEYRGLYCLGRESEDDSSIIETWV